MQLDWCEYELNAHAGSVDAWNLSERERAVKLARCIASLRPLLTNVMWHSKYTACEGRIVFFRAGLRFDDPIASKLRDTLQVALESDRLGSVTKSHCNIIEVFRRSCAEYQEADIGSFVPVWKLWSSYFVERADAAPSQLLCSFNDLHRAVKRFLDQGDSAKLHQTLAVLGESVPDQVIDQLKAILMPLGFCGVALPTARDRRHGNMRHLLLNTIMCLGDQGRECEDD